MNSYYFPCFSHTFFLIHFIPKLYRRRQILSNKKETAAEQFLFWEYPNLSLSIPPLKVLYAPTIAERHRDVNKCTHNLRILKKCTCAQKKNPYARAHGFFAFVYLCVSGCFCLPLYFCVAAGTPFALSSDTASTARSTASFIAGSSSSVTLDSTQSAKS